MLKSFSFPDDTAMSDDGFDISISDVNDSSESSIRSSACVDIAVDNGRFIGGGAGAVRFFLIPVNFLFRIINFKNLIFFDF